MGSTAPPTDDVVVLRARLDEKEVRRHCHLVGCGAIPFSLPPEHPPPPSPTFSPMKQALIARLQSDAAAERRRSAELQDSLSRARDSLAQVSSAHAADIEALRSAYAARYDETSRELGEARRESGIALMKAEAAAAALRSEAAQLRPLEPRLAAAESELARLRPLEPQLAESLAEVERLRRLLAAAQQAAEADKWESQRAAEAAAAESKRLLVESQRAIEAGLAREAALQAALARAASEAAAKEEAAAAAHAAAVGRAREAGAAEAARLNVRGAGRGGACRGRILSGGPCSRLLLLSRALLPFPLILSLPLPG